MEFLLRFLTPDLFLQVVKWFLNQGLAIGLLVFFAVHQDGELKAVKLEQIDLRNQLFNYVKNDRDTLKVTVNEATIVLKEVKTLLKNGKR
jgi:hypothetical protein